MSHSQLKEDQMGYTRKPMPKKGGGTKKGGKK